MLGFIMGRGGLRVGAGSKPAWKNGKTKTIRVPEVLADKIMEYAKNLDDGEIIESVSESKIINLSGIPLKTYNGKLVVYLEDLVKAGFEILPSTLGDMFKAILRQRLEK
jgi:hypothetical protein